MDENLIEKTDIFYLDIPYLLNINMYSLKAFAMQYHYNFEFFGGLLWFSLNFAEYNQLLKIGIWKVYFQFGPGVKP